MTHTLSVRYARYGLWLVRSFGLTLLLALVLLCIKLSNQPFIQIKRVEARANTTIDTTLEDAIHQAEFKIAKMQQLQDLLLGFSESYEGDFSIMVTDLASGETAQLNSEQVMNSASLYKAFLVFYAFREIDAGNLSYNDPFLDDQTVKTCLEKVITVSDNPCGVEFQRRYGQTATVYFNDLGLTSTQLTGEYPQTNASDVAQLFSLINSGQGLSAESTSMFQDLLTRQQINPRIPALLPADVTVMHKTGDLDSVCHDGGIIEAGGQRYSLVVMSDNWPVSQSQKNQAAAQLSLQIFEIMTQP